MNSDPIFTAVEQLREVAGDGPATRKVLDALFRHVHNLKANASAKGLSELKTRMPYADLAAFEKNPQFENIGDLFTVDLIVRYVKSKVG